MRQRILPTACGWCALEELSRDVPVNLKAALHHLLAAPKLAKPLSQQIRALCVRLAAVTLVAVPDRRASAPGVLHRPTAHYRLLLSIRQLMHEEVLPTQKTGERLFCNLTGNEKRMAALFGRFVRNFFRRRQATYQIGAETLTWAVAPPTAGAGRAACHAHQCVAHQRRS